MCLLYGVESCILIESNSPVNKSSRYLVTEILLTAGELLSSLAAQFVRSTIGSTDGNRQGQGREPATHRSSLSCRLCQHHSGDDADLCGQRCFSGR